MGVELAFVLGDGEVAEVGGYDGKGGFLGFGVGDGQLVRGLFCCAAGDVYGGFVVWLPCGGFY